MYYIPKVVDCIQDLTKWVYSSDHKELLDTPTRELPEYVRKFTQDSYMCIYVTPDAKMWCNFFCLTALLPVIITVICSNIVRHFPYIFFLVLLFFSIRNLQGSDFVCYISLWKWSWSSCQKTQLYTDRCCSKFRASGCSCTTWLSPALNVIPMSDLRWPKCWIRWTSFLFHDPEFSSTANLLIWMHVYTMCV